jgi:tripartite-type tricarboxylate transporter receptor subunit TctC
VVDAGKVRPIAITSKTRFRGLPDLPAVSETLPGIAIDGFFGIVAPAGTPADIVARLNREIAEYLKGPEIQQRLISFGLATEGAGTPESTAQFIREEQDRWRALAQELGVEPQ